MKVVSKKTADNFIQVEIDYRASKQMRTCELSPETLLGARTIFDYLALSSNKISCADVIIGFGHFDLNIPRYCGVLYEQGYAGKIIFTGGIGSGTADLGRAEALAFAEEFKHRYPHLPDDVLILEHESTNTAENIQFTTQKLAADYPDFSFGAGIQRAILVANAYRQRRVWRTCQQHLPNIQLYNAPPPTSFEAEMQRFSQKGLNLIELLVGEIDRIIHYGDKGYLAPEQIPPGIYDAYLLLTKRGYLPAG